MNEHLISLEKRAFALKNSGKPAEAAILFQDILKEQPDWEHGYGAFNLAQCYEDEGKIDQARLTYEKTVEGNPQNTIFLGAYASFLYLHGTNREAFDAHLRLLAIELVNGNAKGSATTIVALNELGRKLDLSQESIDLQIAELRTGKRK